MERPFRPAGPDDLYRWAGALDAVGGASSSVPLWRELLDYAPHDVHVLACLVRALADTGAAADALDLIDAVAPSARTAELRLAEAEALLASGRAADARVIAEQLVAEMPGDATPWILAARASTALGDHDRALAIARNVADAENDDVSLWLLLRTAAAAEARDTHLEAVDRLLTRNPRDEALLEQRVSLLWSSGKYADAAETLVVLADERPSDESIPRMAAEAYYEPPNGTVMWVGMAVPVPGLQVFTGFALAAKQRVWRRRFSPAAVALARRGRRLAWVGVAARTWVAAVLFALFLIVPIVVALASEQALWLVLMFGAYLPLRLAMRAERARLARGVRAPVPSSKCRCTGDVGGFSARYADAYAAHLVEHARFGARGIVELRCPATGWFWLMARTVGGQPILVRLVEGADASGHDFPGSPLV